jgi:nitroreductase
MDVIPRPPSPWDVNARDFPCEGSDADRLRFILRYAVLAPSTRNTQPWRFAIDQHDIAVHLDLSRWQRVADPDRREMHISVGCAIENLVVAACHFGYRAAVDHIPPGDDPTLVARVRLLPGGCPSRASATRASRC